MPARPGDARGWPARSLAEILIAPVATAVVSSFYVFEWGCDDDDEDNHFLASL